MNDHKLKPKFLRGMVGNLSQLMFGHFPMRFIFNSFDVATSFKSAHYSPKIDNRFCGEIRVLGQRSKWRFGHQDFANEICHTLKVLVTVTSSPKSSKNKILK